MTGAVSDAELAQFRTEAFTWLESQLPLRQGWRGDRWGQGWDGVPVFNSFPDEAAARALLTAGASWQATKYDAGYSAMSLPAHAGGRGLDHAYERTFAEVEALFETPPWDELLEVTTELVAPTLAVHGTAALQGRFLRPLLRADQLCCQLFSEPGAGSDLAALSTFAERTGDGWRVNGLKTWSSGAQHADLGLLIARTDRDVPRHRGMTAFLLPLSTQGVEVRPIRQMTGGSSFNEIFLTDVTIPDELRLGEPGDGWSVALTTLKFEREHSARNGGTGLANTLDKVLALVEHQGCADDPLIRQSLGALAIQVRLVQLTAQRVQESMESGAAPGPEGSIGKLLWSDALRQVSDVVTQALDTKLVADTGEWGTFTWAQHVLGAPGYRIAGGSDEIQRTIIGERVLGLPKGKTP